MAPKWNLIEVLERVANQKTGEAPVTDEKVVTILGLDKLAKAIRELQSQLVHCDGEEHKLMLALNEIERESDAMHADIKARRDEVTANLQRLQTQLVEAVKSCGIKAEIRLPEITP